MSDLGFNKVAGAVLATGLAIFGLRELSDIVYEKHPVEKPGYAIAVEEEGAGGGAAAELPADWGTVLPVADIAAGEAIRQKCASCHSFEAGGANGIGPNLYAVVNRKPAGHAGFGYSAPMTEYGSKNPAWTYERLDAFLKNPGAEVAGTKMTFVGLKKQQDRINMIAYLRSLAASPAPIPAPNPAAAAPAASGAAAGSEAPAASGGTVVASGGTASNAGAQVQAPQSGAAAAPTQTSNTGAAPG